MADEIADAHSGHAVNLREGPRHQHFRILRDHGDRGGVGRIGRVVVVGLVHQHVAVGRCGAVGLDELGDLSVRVDAPGGIVGIADERHPGAGRNTGHRLEIVQASRGHGHRTDFGLRHLSRPAGGFEGRRRQHQSLAGPRERQSDSAENLAGARRQHDGFGRHAVRFRQRLRQLPGRLPAVAAGLRDDFVDMHRRDRRWRQPVVVLVATEPEGGRRSGAALRPRAGRCRLPRCGANAGRQHESRCAERHQPCHLAAAQPPCRLTVLAIVECKGHEFPSQ